MKKIILLPASMMFALCLSLPSFANMTMEGHQAMDDAKAEMDDKMAAMDDAKAAMDEVKAACDEAMGAGEELGDECMGPPE